VYLVGMHLRS